ncbi:hypothetical protein G6F63_015573 [Rhizopus arrhizus]|nr:hypothetical protein G6F65_022307 [Rhizopus arrhizus]KAG1317668.1 hypothetical protein G6F63_015573 [Rhizopus arrhizus]
MAAAETVDQYVERFNNPSSSGQKKSSAFVSGSVLRSAPYPKASRKHCSFHKTTNHSNDECRAMKKASSSSPSSVESKKPTFLFGTSVPLLWC